MTRSQSAWRALGEIRRIDDRSLFVIDTGGDREPLVALHGYPTSSHDFHEVLPALAARFRVVLHDHLGFGLSDKPRDYSYSLLEQTDVAERLWTSLGIERAHVVAHDYGTSVATELVARHHEGRARVGLASVTLSNGSVHIEMARLRPIQKALRNRLLGPFVARLSSKRIFRRNMRALWSDPDSLGDDAIETMWSLLTRADGKKVLPRITQYLRDRETYWDRWVGALRTTDVPLAFLWGADDPITGPAVARTHHDESPGSRLVLLDGVGHYPMLEAPARWTDSLVELIDTAA